MVEQNEAFLQRSATYLGPAGDRVERKIAQGLQVGSLLWNLKRPVVRDLGVCRSVFIFDLKYNACLH